MSDSSKPVNCRIFLAGALRAARWLLAARQASHLDSAVVFQIIFCLELFISRILFCSRSHFRLSPHSPCLYFIKPIALSSGFCLGKQKRERSWEISLALACCPKGTGSGRRTVPQKFQKGVSAGTVLHPTWLSALFIYSLLYKFLFFLYLKGIELEKEATTHSTECPSMHSLPKYWQQLG